MTDTQILDGILKAYTKWNETIRAMSKASDRPDVMDCYEKEIANLEYAFFRLIDKAI